MNRPKTRTGDVVIVRRHGVATYGTILESGAVTPHTSETGTIEDAIQWALVVSWETGGRVFLDEGSGWIRIAEAGKLRKHLL
jgi:hypothetical protein